jgi:arginine/serine-rich coiled-coil protein 2
LKTRHRSKSVEKSTRRKSISSSPERQKKAAVVPLASPIVRQLASTSSSSSPQKSPMISLGNPVVPQPVEPKVELPAYYNPNVINATKFADQQKKRKLIWSGKKDEPAKDAAKWGGAKFSQDVDGTKASKFMRLMGIKDGKI